MTQLDHNEVDDIWLHHEAETTRQLDHNKADPNKAARPLRGRSESGS